LTLNVDLLAVHDVEDVERLAGAFELSNVSFASFFFNSVSIFDVTEFA
jgi:hypothetical protein